MTLLQMVVAAFNHLPVLLLKGTLVQGTMILALHPAMMPLHP
jgi:hypothetical protein